MHTVLHGCCSCAMGATAAGLAFSQPIRRAPFQAMPRWRVLFLWTKENGLLSSRHRFVSDGARFWPQPVLCAVNGKVPSVSPVH